MQTDAWVTIEEAAWVAGVSIPVVGGWIQRGWLTSSNEQGAQLVLAENIPAACAKAAEERLVMRHVNGRHGSVERLDASPAEEVEDATLVHHQTQAMLSLIRDEWLEPYLSQIAELTRNLGRLDAQRRAAQRRARRAERALAELEERYVTVEAERQTLEARRLAAESLEARIEDHERQLAELQERIAAGLTRTSSSDAELAALRQAIRDLRQQLAAIWSVQDTEEQERRASVDSRPWWRWW